MSALALPLFWCAVQVTLLSVAALLLHVAASRLLRFPPVSIGIASLVIIIGLTCTAFSPWPRWPGLQDPLESAFASRTAGQGCEVPATVVPATVVPVTDRSAADVPGGEPATAGTTPSLLSAEPLTGGVTRPSPAPPVPANHSGGSVFVLFCCGAALLGLLRFAGGLLAVRGYVSRSAPLLDAQALEEFDILQAELGIPREIDLRESDDLLTAATVGWRRPVILLPRGWTEWTRGELRAVLGHELAHIAHYDYPAWLGAQAALILHFYNPLVHWLAARLRLDQELAADATAARLAGGERPYLRMLADMALRQTDAPLSWPARAFLPTRGTFMRRIEMLRDKRTRTPRRTSLTAQLLTAALLVGAGLAVAGLRPAPGIAAPPTVQADPIPLVLPETAPDDGASINSSLLGAESPTVLAQNDAPKKEETSKDSEFQSADEAFGVGAAYYNSKNYAKSREPFEAALKLAPDDAFRLKVYKALIPSYRLLSEADKMYTATEYVLEHGTQAAEKSLLTRSLLSFIFERGKTDEAVKRYEEQLKKDPKNRTALTVLSQIYTEIKRDPQKGGELVERLAALDKEENKPLDVRQAAQLAMQYVRAKKFKEGAELYEKIAPLDEKLAAWHWKEAADAWVKAGDKPRALEAAKKSAASRGETRSDQLTYFWHRGLGDAFLDAGDAASAIPHLEKALELTDIDGYLKATRERLEEARTKAAGK